MQSILSTIASISAEVVNQLALKGWPPLATLVNGNPGQIILLDKHLLDQYIPPRIYMMPIRSGFGPRDTSRGYANVSMNDSNGKYDPQSYTAVANQAIFSHNLTYEVGCWSFANTAIEPDPYGSDFDYTLALAEIFIASCQAVMPGCFELVAGGWENVSQAQRVGRQMTFGVTVHLPVLRRPAPPAISGLVPGMQHAPPGVAPNLTDWLTLPDGTTSPGCEDPNGG